MKNRSLALLREHFTVFLHIFSWWKWFLLIFCTLSILLNKNILFKVLKFFIFFILLILFKNFTLLRIMWLWSEDFSLQITFKIAAKLVWIGCCCYTSRVQLLLFKVLFIQHFLFVFASYFIYVKRNTPFFVFLLKYCFQSFDRVCFFYIDWFTFFLFFILFYLWIFIWLKILFIVFLVGFLPYVF